MLFFSLKRKPAIPKGSNRPKSAPLDPRSLNQRNDKWNSSLKIQIFSQFGEFFRKIQRAKFSEKSKSYFQSQTNFHSQKGFKAKQFFVQLEKSKLVTLKTQILPIRPLYVIENYMTDRDTVLFIKFKGEVLGRSFSTTTRISPFTMKYIIA